MEVTCMLNQRLRIEKAGVPLTWIEESDFLCIDGVPVLGVLKVPTQENVGPWCVIVLDIQFHKPCHVHGILENPYIAADPTRTYRLKVLSLRNYLLDVIGEAVTELAQAEIQSPDCIAVRSNANLMLASLNHSGAAVR
jgi:hypothetical protein